MSTPNDGRLHLRIDPELKRWVKGWAAERTRTEGRKVEITMVIEELLVELRQRVSGAKDAEQL